MKREKSITRENLYKIIIAVVTIMVGIVAAIFIMGREPSKIISAQEKLSLPSAGIGNVVESFLSTTGEKNQELLGNTIIYHGDEVLNIYSKIPGNEIIEKGESLGTINGRLLSGSEATFIGEHGNWYEIVSGGVKGFVRKENFYTGDEAEKNSALALGNEAEVTSEEARLYDGVEETSGLICVLPKGTRLPVVEEGENVCKVYVQGLGEAYIGRGDIELKKVKRVASSIDEEGAYTQTIVSGINGANEITQQQNEEAAASEQTYAISYIEPAPPDSDDVAAIRQAVANYAQQFVGILPYVYGGTSLETGADCSGFVQAVYAAYGYSLPRISDEQTWSGTPVSLDDLRPGDVVGYGGHVAIYVGDGMVVHAPSPGRCVEYNKVDMMPIVNVSRYIN